MTKRVSKNVGKRAEPINVTEIVRVDIRTTGDHNDYLDWCLEQLPDPYSYDLSVIDNGFRAEIKIQEDGNKFFACRYLANIALEIRSLDEGNVKVIPFTAELESAE